MATDNNNTVQIIHQPYPWGTHKWAGGIRGVTNKSGLANVCLTEALIVSVYGSKDGPLPITNDGRFESWWDQPTYAANHHPLTKRNPSPNRYEHYHQSNCIWVSKFIILYCDFRWVGPGRCRCTAIKSWSKAPRSASRLRHVLTGERIYNSERAWQTRRG
jgi:hypothetical protein